VRRVFVRKSLRWVTAIVTLAASEASIAAETKGAVASKGQKWLGSCVDQQ